MVINNTHFPFSLLILFIRKQFFAAGDVNIRSLFNVFPWKVNIYVILKILETTIVRAEIHGNDTNLLICKFYTWLLYWYSEFEIHCS